MRSLQWLTEKKSPVRDAEEQKKASERRSDSQDICGMSCHEMRSSPIRNIR